MTEKEIRDLIDQVVDKVKSFDKQVNNRQKAELPDYYPTYREAVEYIEMIMPHSEKGYFPEKLFEKRSPNQTELEETWYRNNHKQITLPLFVDYNSTVQRIFHDSNWDIKYKDSGEFQDYVQKEMPIYGSLENFVKEILPPLKAVDANGCIVIKPKEIPTVEFGDKTIIDPDKQIQPIPFYYSSKQKVAYESGKYYLFELNRKSMVEYGNSSTAMGHIYELYDDNTIYLITQVGRFIDYTFDIVVYYEHGWGQIPVQTLKGIPVYKDGSILWQSPFLYVTDLLDQALLDNSYLMCCKAKVGYPYRISIGRPCDFHNDATGEKCIDGYLIGADVNQRRVCNVCHGSGMKSRFSPQGEMLINSDAFAQDNIKPADAVHFASPGQEDMKFLREEIDYNILKGYGMLHIQDANRSIQFNEVNKTATGSENNQKGLYAFLKPISDQLFDLFEFITNAIGAMREKGKFKAPEFIYPTTYDFTTQEDYIEQIKAARDSQQPSFVIYTLIYKFLSSLFYNEKTTADVFDLVMKTDRFVTLSNMEIESKVAKGLADRWEAVLHDSAITFINELQTENEKFWDLKFPERQKLLIEKAKAVATLINPTVTRDNLINNIATQ